MGYTFNRVKKKEYVELCDAAGSRIRWVFPEDLIIRALLGPLDLCHRDFLAPWGTLTTPIFG